MYKSKIKNLSLILTFVILLTSIPIFSNAANITAHSAISIDYDTGLTLYEKNADELMVPASMTKILTVFIAFEEIEAGNLSMDSMIWVSPKNASLSTNRNYPANVRLVANKSYSLDHLIKLIMLPSASASCIVLAEHISGSEANFVKRMNQTLKDLGLTGEFYNSHGAHINYITPRSMAELVRIFINRYPEILNYTSLKSVYHEGRNYPNTNGFISGEYNYKGVDGFKTGTIPAAGFCLASTSKKDGNRVISIVMNSQNNHTRHTDSIKVLDNGFNNLENYRNSVRNTKLEFLNTPRNIRANTNYRFEVQASNVNTPYKTDLVWKLNDKVYKTQKNVTINNDTKLILPFVYLEDDTDNYEITVELDLPTMDVKASTGVIAASEKEAAIFRDIHGNFAEDEIVFLYNKGLTNGISEDLFGVNHKMDRAMFVTILGRLIEDYGLDHMDSYNSNFKDVTEKDYFSNYVSWAENRGLVEGYDNKFYPKDFITREEMISIIDRLILSYNIKLPKLDDLPNDMDQVSDWAYDSVERIYKPFIKNFIKDNNLDPQKEVSRSEMAKVLVNLVEYLDNL